MQERGHRLDLNHLLNSFMFGMLMWAHSTVSLLYRQRNIQNKDKNPFKKYLYVCAQSLS